MTKTKCPFCSEEILADAKKCKHCGEWLENPSIRFSTPSSSSIDARAVTKGMKEAQYSKSIQGLLVIITLIISVPIGLFIHWLVGLVVFVAIVLWMSKKYYEE